MWVYHKQPGRDLSVLDMTPLLASVISVLMPSITENPFKFIQEKIKGTPLCQWTSRLHYLSALLPIARDGHLRQNTLVNQESAFPRLISLRYCWCKWESHFMYVHVDNNRRTQRLVAERWSQILHSRPQSHLLLSAESGWERGLAPLLQIPFKIQHLQQSVYRERCVTSLKDGWLWSRWCIIISDVTSSVAEFFRYLAWEPIIKLN